MSSEAEKEPEVSATQGNPAVGAVTEPYVWTSRFCGTLENLEDLNGLRLQANTHKYETVCGSLMSGSWFCLNPARHLQVQELPPEPIFLQPSKPDIPEAILNYMETDGALQVELWSPPPPPVDPFVWHFHFVAMVAPWINVDSKDERVRELSTQALKQELDVYRKLHTRAVVIRLRRDHEHLADILDSYLHDKHLPPSRRIKFWMLIEPTEVGDKQNDTWEWWLRLRTRLRNSENVQVCLEVVGETRLRWDGLAYLRWMSEPVAAVFLHQGLFSAAGKLIQVHQLLIRKFFAVGNDWEARVILAPAPYDQLMGQLSGDLHVFGENETRYFWHLNFLLKKRMERKAVESKMGGRQKRAELLYPLMPLSDNLPSSIYESFEADNRKYGKYMVAVKFALSSLAYNGKCFARVVVLGAGRGPIVTMVRRALESLQSVDHGPYLQIQLFAVEKNPHAVISLQYMNETEWNGEVEVVESDMRSWFPGWTADLVVSELIGGFSDNELSPECLDGASHLMDTKTLSIPAWYQSVLAPVQAPKMLHLINRMSAVSSGLQGSVPSDKMWVTRVLDRFRLDVPKPYPAVVFRFEHPAPAGGNEKYGRRVMNFQARETGELTGFAGFMDVGLWASDHRDQDGVFLYSGLRQEGTGNPVGVQSPLRCQSRLVRVATAQAETCGRPEPERARLPHPSPIRVARIPTTAIDLLFVCSFATFIRPLYERFIVLG